MITPTPRLVQKTLELAEGDSDRNARFLYGFYMSLSCVELDHLLSGCKPFVHSYEAHTLRINEISKYAKLTDELVEKYQDVLIIENVLENKLAEISDGMKFFLTLKYGGVQ